MTRKPPAIDVSGLRNDGILLVRGESRPAAERTFIVLGVARGGTTLIAKVLHSLGVHMGDKLSSVQEDVEVCRPMESGDLEALRTVVARRNACHPRWGFKRPGAVEYIRRFESEFRNPNYLIVFRDIFALTNRNRLSVSQDPLHGLRSAAQQYVRLAELAGALSAPTLLVSYEKALLAPETFVSAVAEFAGVDDPSRLDQARAAVQPGNERYLEESRTRRGLGRLEGVTGRSIKGWAAVTGVRASVDVCLRINGEELAVVKADLVRENLKTLNLSTAGAHAFEYLLPDGVQLAPGDQLSARVVGEIKDLANSPLTISGKPAAASSVAAVPPMPASSKG